MKSWSGGKKGTSCMLEYEIMMQATTVDRGYLDRVSPVDVTQCFQYMLQVIDHL